MKFIEIQGGISTPIFEEELSLYDKILNFGGISKNKLSERENEVAKYLVSRGILRRMNIDKQIIYKASVIDKDVWGL